MSRLADALRLASDSDTPVLAEEQEWPVVQPPTEQPATEPAPVSASTWFRLEPHSRNDDHVQAETSAFQFSDEVAQKLVIDHRSRPAAVEQYPSAGRGTSPFTETVRHQGFDGCQRGQ